VFKGAVGLWFFNYVILWFCGSVVLCEVDSPSLPRVRCWYASHHWSDIRGKTNLISYENFVTRAHDSVGNCLEEKLILFVLVLTFSGRFVEP
jgi:hypothetical protein